MIFLKNIGRWTLSLLLFLQISPPLSSQSDLRESGSQEQNSEMISTRVSGMISFIDIGEGDATLIVTPEKERILIDTGSPAGLENLLLELKREKIDSLDLLILTHPHLDHIGNVFSLLSLFSIKKIYDNAEELNQNEVSFYSLYAEKIRGLPQYSPLSYPQELALKKGTLSVLSSSKEGGWNDKSLVLLFQYGEFSLLLMGDAGELVETKLLETKILDQLDEIDLLQAGHHGAKGTASPPFLSKIDPSKVIVSVDENNRNGYPDDNVLERYRQRGADVELTKEEGTIRYRFSADGWYAREPLSP